MSELNNKILELLHQAEDEYISGEKISNKLGVSRTAVWKHIKKMRNNGYEIKSLTNKGYKLLGVPETLAAGEIKMNLSTYIIGSKIFVYQSIDSTNNKAKDLARKGAEEGSVVAAEEQTAGKGRLGRSWHSKKGSGLWISIIVRPDISPAKAPYLTIAAALALKGALNDYDSQKNGGGLKLQIKWPNDLLLDGKKLSGILSELSADPDKIKYAVIGIGLNANQEDFPDEIQSKAISLKQYTGKKTDRNLLLQLLLEHFECYYKLLLKGKYNELLTDWKKELKLMGERVKVLAEKREYYGEVVDISSRGELVIKDSEGKTHSFWAGDVSLRKGEKS